VVESHRCSFPFSSGESEHYSCQPSNSSESTEYCYSQIGQRHVYGICNGGCYQEDGETPIVFEEEDPMAFFCKTAASECQFPFIWNDVEYTTCTMEGSEFYWCALELDTQGVMLDKKWGKCDMSTCDLNREEDLEEARAVFSERVRGLILFSQKSSLDPLVVEGKLTEGLEDGQYSLKISSTACGTSGTELGSVTEVQTRNNVTNISLEMWDVSLYPHSSHYCGAGSVRLEEVCSPLLSEHSVDCDVVKTLACANVQLGKGTDNINLILIISLVVFSILLLLLTVILVISCYRRFCPRTKQNIGGESLGSSDDIYRDLRRSKTPLYDELSIPFIDASLPPTPKVGRSSNPLEILLGKMEGSKNSLEDYQSGN